MRLLKLSTLFFSVVIPGALLPFSSVYAESCSDDKSCKVDVLFKGTYLEHTCDIVINNGSSDETLILPTLSTNVLSKAGAEAGSIAFSITLTGCPTDKTVSLWFSGAGGNADQTTGNLINASGNGYSENVQVRIRNNLGAQIVVDDKSSVQDYVIPASGVDISHDYQAMYYAKAGVTPGRVNTSAGINLIYR